MKTQWLIVSLLVSFLGFAQQSLTKTDSKNLLAELTTADLGQLNWMNPPKSFSVSEGTLTIDAPKGSDYFNNPEDGQVTARAPFLFMEVEGDFIAKTLVQPDFSSQWNAVALMAYLDENNWIKFAFENSDATGPSIVTVVTKSRSDDANGVILKGNETIWLKLIRKGDNYSMLWSEDDTDYKMARLTTLPKSTSIKIGIEAQSPVGETAVHKISYFGFEKKTVKDMRKGL